MTDDDNAEDVPPEDVVEDVAGDYIPAGQKSKDVQDLRNVSHWGLHSAFLAAIGHRMRTTEANAYKDLLLSEAEIRHAEAGLIDAQISKEKTIRKLMDAETIHDADKRRRDADLDRAKAEAFEAKEYLKQQEHEALIAEFFRESEIANMKAQRGAVSETLSKAERGWSKREEELWERLSASVEPFRADSLIDQFMKENKLTDEQKADIMKITRNYKRENE